MDSIKKGDKGLDCRVMADRMKAYPVVAVHKMTLTRINGRRCGSRLRVGGRPARMTDHRGGSLRVGVSVCQWDRWWDEQINGEGHREVLRVSEGEEGAMWQVRVSVR